MNSKKKVIIIVVIVILGILLGFGGYFLMNKDSKPKESKPEEKPEVKKDYSIENETEVDLSFDKYIYKIKFDFGCESYIYLLEDERVMSVAIMDEYTICEGTNCMVPTGNVNVEEKEVKLSEEGYKKARKVMDSLSKKAELKEFDADKMELDDEEMRVLLGLVIGSEVNFMVEDYLKLEEVDETIMGVSVTKTVVSSEFEDEFITNFVNNLNALINKKVQDNVSSSGEDSNYTVKLELAYTGPYSVSFTLKEEGQLGATGIYAFSGYNYSYAGTLKEFPNGWKEKYYKLAVDEFKKSDLYKESSNELARYWENLLKENMFNEGNWYITKGKINFVVDASILGISSSTAKLVDISVDIQENDDF